MPTLAEIRAVEDQLLREEYTHEMISQGRHAEEVALAKKISKMRKKKHAQVIQRDLLLGRRDRAIDPSAFGSVDVTEHFGGNMTPSSAFLSAGTGVHRASVSTSADHGIGANGRLLTRRQSVDFLQGGDFKMMNSGYDAYQRDLDGAARDYLAEPGVPAYSTALEPVHPHSTESLLSHAMRALREGENMILNARALSESGASTMLSSPAAHSSRTSLLSPTPLHTPSVRNTCAGTFGSPCSTFGSQSDAPLGAAQHEEHDRFRVGSRSDVPLGAFTRKHDRVTKFGSSSDSALMRKKAQIQKKKKQRDPIRVDLEKTKIRYIIDRLQILLV